MSEVSLPKTLQLGYTEYSEDETFIYNCGGLPVELILPKGKHKNWWLFQGFLLELVELGAINTNWLLEP